MPIFSPRLPIDTTLFDHLAAGVVLCDLQDSIVWVNDCFLEMMAADKNSVTGAPLSSLMKQNLTAVVSQPDITRYRTTNDKGESLWLHCITSPVETRGVTTHKLHILVDITEFEQRHNLRSLVDTGLDVSRLDKSSGVLNRRTIIQELNAEISRTRRYGNPLSLILLHFPLSVTLAGQQSTGMLQTLANVLNGQLRWVDKLGVLDKGEFLVVLPESSLDSAHQTWAKISHALQEMTIRREQMNSDYSVAVTAWMNNDTADAMIERLGSMLVEQKVA